MYSAKWKAKDALSPVLQVSPAFKFLIYTTSFLQRPTLVLAFANWKESMDRKH